MFSRDNTHMKMISMAYVHHIKLCAVSENITEQLKTYKNILFSVITAVRVPSLNLPATALMSKLKEASSFI